MDMRKLIKAALFTPMHAGPKFTGNWGLPIVFVGEPGCGKSSVIKQVAAECSMGLKLLSPAEQGEAAFGVIPVPENGIITYPAPDWTLETVRLNADGALDPRGEAFVVFVDELSTAMPHIQGPAMGLILDGRIGNTQLGGRVRRIAAMNETQHAAGGWDIAAALCNRFGWYKWQGSTETEFAAYWLGGADAINSVDVDAEEARVLAAWPTEWANTVGKFTAFIQRTPNMLGGEPKPGERAFATRRSIAAAMHAYTAANIHGFDHDERSEFCRGFVGEAWWQQFVTFCDSLADLPLPADVLDGKSSFKHSPTRLDISYVFLASAAALVVGEQDKTTRNKRGEALWSILADVTAGAKDVGFDAAWGLSRAGVAVACKDAIKVQAKLEAYRQQVKAATK